MIIVYQMLIQYIYIALLEVDKFTPEVSQKIVISLKSILEYCELISVDDELKFKSLSKTIQSFSCNILDAIDDTW